MQIRILQKIKRRHSNAPVFLQSSLRQYDCHAYYFLRPVWYLFNFFSVFALLPLLLFLSLRSLKKIGSEKILHIALYPKVPKPICDQYSPVYIKKPLGCFKKSDFQYILQICKFGFLRPYFMFRLLWKLAVYSELIDSYCPQRIWVTQEMVFESSFLTAYCESHNVEHVNFMHGENYFSIQIAFAGFSQIYVWDEYYVQLFSSLLIQAKRYVIFSPLERSTSGYSQKNIIKYYNQVSQNNKTFNQILDNLERFAKLNKCEIVVRLHPLHKTEYEIKSLRARNIPLEEDSIDIVDSISEAKYICSEFSSVLYIGSLLNRHIVIDNTFQERIDLIKDLDPIFIKKLKHQFLVTV